MRLPRGEIEVITRRQASVASVAQLCGRGADRTWISRQVDSGRWQRPLPGVVVTHSGPLPWPARAWAAVLYAGDGAGLSHAAAARSLGFRTADPSVIDVLVPERRRVRDQPGLRVRRRVRMPDLTAGLPVVNRADTAVDLVAAAAATDEAISWLCDALRAGTWPHRIVEAAAGRRRLPNRHLLTELLTLTAEGVESALELRYGTDVEARHGLPVSMLQRRQAVGSGWIRADRVYDGLGVRVELDGWLGHPGGRTDADTWRDNEVLVRFGDITLRLRWRHVSVTPCESALLVARALRTRGWQGHPTPCSPRCAIHRGPLIAPR